MTEPPTTNECETTGTKSTGPRYQAGRARRMVADPKHPFGPGVWVTEMVALHPEDETYFLLDFEAGAYMLGWDIWYCKRRRSYCSVDPILKEYL